MVSPAAQEYYWDLQTVVTLQYREAGVGVGVSRSTGVTVLDNVVMFTLFAATRSIDIHKPGCADLDANGQFVKKIGECMHVGHEKMCKLIN